MYRNRYNTRTRQSYSNSSYGTVSAVWMPQVNAYKLHFPYNENFIKLLKTKIPVNERSYDPDDNHAWYISEEMFNIFLPLMRAAFNAATFNIIDKATVDQYNQGMASTQIVSTDKLAEEFYQLLERAGLQTDRTSLELGKIKKLYLRAARVYHPDLNKDTASAGSMSRLNELWSNLQGVYFK